MATIISIALHPLVVNKRHGIDDLYSTKRCKKGFNENATTRPLDPVVYTCLNVSCISICPGTYITSLQVVRFANGIIYIIDKVKHLFDVVYTNKVSFSQLRHPHVRTAAYVHYKRMASSYRNRFIPTGKYITELYVLFIVRHFQNVLCFIGNYSFGVPCFPRFCFLCSMYNGKYVYVL